MKPCAHINKSLAGGWCNDCGDRLIKPSPAAPDAPKSGIAAIFGTWPGNETDEEIEEALYGDKRRAEAKRTATERVIAAARRLLAHWRDDNAEEEEMGRIERELGSAVHALDAACDSSSNHKETK